MTKDRLARVYRDYIACLNRRDLSALERYVDEGASHNGRPLGLSGYREMLPGRTDIDMSLGRRSSLFCHRPRGSGAMPPCAAEPGP